MCKKILFLIFIICSPLFAQDESEIDDDNWNELQGCIEAKTIDPVIDEKIIFEILVVNELKLEDQVLLMIEENYRKVVRKIIKESIKKASKFLPELKKQFNNDVEVSIELRHKFDLYFTASYSKKYNLNKCARSKNDIPVFSYIEFFKSTNKIISTYECKLNKNNIRFSNRDNYLTYSLLFKMAILKYKPDLSKYVTDEILQDWHKVFPEHRIIQ